MLGLSKYKWVYKAKYWEVEGGKFHWHNPKTNQVEEFHQDTSSHEKIEPPKEAKSHEMSFSDWAAHHKISGPDAEQAWRRNVGSAIARGENVSDEVKNEYNQRQSAYDANRKQRDAELFKPADIKDDRGFIEEEDWRKIKRTDPDDGYYYHVTSQENADRINESGVIAPGNKPITGRAGFYQEHSRGRVFFTDRAGVPYWVGNTEMTLSEANEESDSDVEPELAVIRVPKKSVGKLEVDKPGTDDAKAPAYLTNKPIKIR